ncbi:MAG: hypothetical protein LBU16_03190 [Treponema sp.]|nr:hypothetical protein [Treponema sp.]
MVYITHLVHFDPEPLDHVAGKPPRHSAGGRMYRSVSASARAGEVN